MTNTFNPTGTQQSTGTKNIQPSDIKALIQKHGKTTIGNQEFTLKSHQVSDPKLQAIANDPSLTVKSILNSNGQAECEVSTKDKTLKLKFDVKTIQ